MDLREFERIKELIKKAELKSAKSQGVIDSITSNWKEKYGFSTVEEAEAKLREMVEEKKMIETRLDKLMSDLIESYNWDELEKELR